VILVAYAGQLAFEGGPAACTVCEIVEMGNTGAETWTQSALDEIGVEFLRVQACKQLPAPLLDPSDCLGVIDVAAPAVAPIVPAAGPPDLA